MKVQGKHNFTDPAQVNGFDVVHDISLLTTLTPVTSTDYLVVYDADTNENRKVLIDNLSVDHGTLVGLGDDDHTQYALLAGRSGGQTLIGGDSTGDTLTLQGNTTIGSDILVNDSIIPNPQTGQNINLGSHPVPFTEVHSYEHHFEPYTVDPAFHEGLMWYSDADKTLSFYTDIQNTSLQIGEEERVRIYNDTGAQLNNGEVVFIISAHGGSGQPTVELADADLATADKTIGVVTHDIPDTTQGYVTTFGVVRGIDTSAFNLGDELYVSQTAGQLTNVKPVAPAHSVRVGYVTKVNVSSGRILVATHIGTDLKDVHDVYISNTGEVPDDGDLLQYVAANSRWENVDVATAVAGLRFSTNVSSWTLLETGNTLYYNDVTHNLGNTDVDVVVKDNTTNKFVIPQDIEIIDSNTVRIIVEGNTDDLRVTVEGGSTSNNVADHGTLVGLGDDDHTQYLLADGTRALTGNWDAGSFEVRAQTFQSDVVTGTAPLIVASTTLVSNLNTDLLDGQQGTYYLDSANFTGTNWTDLTDGGATTLHKHDHGLLDGLADDDHTQYALLNGRSGGQILNGGTAASDTLRLQNTINTDTGTTNTYLDLDTAAIINIGGNQIVKFEYPTTFPKWTIGQVGVDTFTQIEGYGLEFNSQTDNMNFKTTASGSAMSFNAANLGEVRFNNLGNDVDFRGIKDSAIGGDWLNYNGGTDILTLDSDQTTFSDRPVGFTEHDNGSLADTGASTTAFTIDWTNNSNKQVIDLEGSTGTITATFNNPPYECNLVLKIIQGSGTHNITWPASVKWPGGTAPTITATANAVDVLTFYFDGTNYYGGFLQDMQ